MMRAVLAMIVLVGAVPLAAQIFPRPSGDRERIQTVAWSPDQTVVLTMLPDTPLVVVLEPGDTIADVQLEPEGKFTIRVSAERDSFTILPLAHDARSSLDVTTGRRTYRFVTKVDYGPEAAVLVRYTYGAQELATGDRPEPRQLWQYSLRGDHEVRPQAITDDGIRTRITYAQGQHLPAVFAIGPTGKEEVVNGYMRGEAFEIDRVYDELVFRIDKEKATARRNDEPEAME